MKDVLESLFFGEIKCYQNFTKTPRFQEMTERAETASDALEETLEGDARKNLNQLLDAHSDIEANTAIECYIEGLRTGFQLALAMMETED